jgi:indole-3-acetate monooxygenase
VPEPALLDLIASCCANSNGTSLPDVVVDALRDQQAFSLLLPDSLHGRQMDFPEFIQFVKSIATADGSTGWCVNQGSILASLARFLPEARAREVWTSPEVSIANGPPIKTTTRRAGDDYVLDGNWAFSSGVNHSSHLLGIATLREDGQAPRGIWHLFPRGQARILESSWQTSGLRGTGSYQFEVSDLRVPADMTFEVGVRDGDPSLYQVPMNLLFACGFASVALGVARGAIDFTLDRVKKKIKRFDANTMSEDQLTQDQIGRAEGFWQSADMFLKYSVAEVWDDVTREGTCSQDNRVKLRLAGTHTIRQAKAVTDIVYDLCSTDSIFQHNDIQKRFQDIHVISQHLQARPEIYSIVGRHYLGLPLNSHLVN